MSFFAKPEYREFSVSFDFLEDSDDAYAGLISLQSCVSIEGVRKYCFASFLVHFKDLDTMDDMIRLLKTPHEKTIKLILKFKNEKYIEFKYDLDSLADAFNDERFRRMDLACSGTNDNVPVY